MKPLMLREPTACCGSPTMLWIPAKQKYVCPCGKAQADIYGRLIAKRKPFNYGRRREG